MLDVTTDVYETVIGQGRTTYSCRTVYPSIFPNGPRRFRQLLVLLRIQISHVL